MVKLKFPKGRSTLLLIAAVAFAVLLSATTATHYHRLLTQLGSTEISEEAFPKPQSPTIVQSDNWKQPPLAAECEQLLHNKPLAQFDVAKRIAFISRDALATLDFLYLSDNLQLEKVNYYNPELWYLSTGRRENYRAILKNGQAERICSNYDLVVVAGSAADGWALIMEGEAPCKNVAFVVSEKPERDLVDSHKPKFLADLARALSREDQFRAHMVVSNNYQVMHLRKQGFTLLQSMISVIRPFGHSTGRAKLVNGDDVPCLLTMSDLDNGLMFNLIREKTDYECLIITSHLGPKTLSMYNAPVVYFPTKMSNWALWENLAHGVVIYVPSPTFLETILSENNYSEAGDIHEAKQFLEANWFQFNDAYMPHWQLCFQQFNSWEELRTMILRKNLAPVINQCRDQMMEHRAENLKDWKKFLMAH